ncbi:unnamed protein product, partial [Amoebophrya sp. A25]|eukprot:GSA25T00023873001.1
MNPAALPGDVWSYNRKLFAFDRGMRMRAQHQKQTERKEWVQLYREDINGLCELFTHRMDVYIALNGLALVGVMSLASPFPPPENVASLDHTALALLFYLSLFSAVVFLIFSTWLAIEGSILAHVSGLHMGFQCKQLRDLPTGVEVDRGRARMQDFEETEASQQMRMPFVDRARNFLFGGGEGRSGSAEVGNN